LIIEKCNKPIPLIVACHVPQRESFNSNDPDNACQREWGQEREKDKQPIQWGIGKEITAVAHNVISVEVVHMCVLYHTLWRMQYLGIDYGSKRVGLALSDEAGTMGLPHSIVLNTPRLTDEICSLVGKEHVGAIVMGESRTLAGGENPIAKDARAFGDLVFERTGVPVYYESEVLTSEAARQAPHKLEKSRSPKSRVPVDDSATRSFLPAIFHVRIMDKPRIPIEEFSKIEVKIGTVQSAERVPETDKLLRLSVDFGEEAGPRQIVSGINAYVPEPESLVGRQLAFVTNLEPRTIRGLESNGMLFAVSSRRYFCISYPDRAVPAGTSAH
jgi:putative transcription antitermination factor YqgF